MITDGIKPFTDYRRTGPSLGDEFRDRLLDTLPFLWREAFVGANQGRGPPGYRNQRCWLSKQKWTPE
jgi:hypothetical protein